MNQEVDRSELVLDDLEHRLHRGVVADVDSSVGFNSDAFAQRPHALFVGLDIAEGQVRTLGRQLSRDTPCNGIAVGDADNQALLAPH